MNENMVECPKCGNVQPRDSEKCYKCGFRLNSYLDYIEAIDAEINGVGKKENETREKIQNKNQKSLKKLITKPLFIFGLVIILIAIGLLIKFAIDSNISKSSNNNMIASQDNEESPENTEPFEAIAEQNDTDSSIEIIYKVKTPNYSEEDFKKALEIISNRASAACVDISINGSMNEGYITVIINEKIDDITAFTYQLCQPGEIFFIYGQGPDGIQNITYNSDGKATLARTMDEIINSGDIILDKTYIAEAEPKMYMDQVSGVQYVVSLKFTSEGTNIFSEATKYAYDKQGLFQNIIAIVCDDEVISAPRVTAVIDIGEAHIQGMENYTASSILANKISNESMPLEFEIIYD